MPHRADNPEQYIEPAVLRDVRMYIQSGNVIFCTENYDTEALIASSVISGG
ncbi:MAG: hypothetical protein WD266_02895 [Balneolales bacterium]